MFKNRLHTGEQMNSIKPSTFTIMWMVMGEYNNIINI